MTAARSPLGAFPVAADSLSIVASDPPHAAHNDPTKSFGMLVRIQRKRRGLTQRDLADRAGISLAAVRDLEQGRSRRPREESLLALVRALGLSEAEVADLRSQRSARQARTVDAKADPSALRIDVLGPLVLRVGGETVPLASAKQRVLLTRLALAAGEVVSRDALLEALWGEDPPATGPAALSTQLTRLRRLLDRGANDRLVATTAGIRLELEPQHLDLLEFRSGVARGTAATEPEVAVRHLAEATDLWRGGVESDPMRFGQVPEAIETEYVAALIALAAAAREAGAPEKSLVPLRAMCGRRPLDEALHAQLIRSLAAAGHQAEALGRYEEIRRALADELGMNPGQQLRSAHLDVIQQRWRGRRPRKSPAPQQLPAPPPNIVGREAVIAEIERALGSDEAQSTGRVVLVSGPAGVGKTSVVLVAAHRLRTGYPDGQLFVDLRAGVGRSIAAVDVVGRFLRAQGVEDVPPDVDEAAALLRSRLAERRVLLVLDNVQEARQIWPLLPGAGRSDVLITSRSVLPDLDGTVSISLDVLDPSDSVRLIQEVSRRSGEDAEAMAAVARSCGDLPLALRIAARQLAHRPRSSAADLARRLDGATDMLGELVVGEVSVLGSFRLSYATLSVQARRTFRMCSLLPADDFGVDSVAVLLDEDEAASRHSLEELLDANMLYQHSAERYRFHDLLRLYAEHEFAGGSGREDGAEPARHRLARWYLDRATAAVDRVVPQLGAAVHADRASAFVDEDAAMAWLDQEYPAMLELVESSVEEGILLDFSWRIVDQLRGYLFLRRREGWLRLAEAGLIAAEKVDDDRARTAMYICRSYARGALGMDDGSLEDTLRASALAEACGWTQAAAWVAHDVGWQRYESGALLDAREWFERSMALADGEESHAFALGLNGFGMALLESGEFEQAAEAFKRAQDLNHAAGRETAVLANQGNRASALRQLGRTVEAQALLDVVLRGYRRRGYPRGVLSTLDEMSRLYVQVGRSSEARTAGQEAYEIARDLGEPRGIALAADGFGWSLVADGDPGAAIAVIHESVAIAEAQGYGVWAARARAHLAEARRSYGEPDSARG